MAAVSAIGQDYCSKYLSQFSAASNPANKYGLDMDGHSTLGVEYDKLYSSIPYYNPATAAYGHPQVCVGS